MRKQTKQEKQNEGGDWVEQPSSDEAWLESYADLGEDAIAIRSERTQVPTDCEAIVCKDPEPEVVATKEHADDDSEPSEGPAIELSSGSCWGDQHADIDSSEVGNPDQTLEPLEKIHLAEILDDYESNCGIVPERGFADGVVLPPGSDLTTEEALALNHEIDRSLRDCDDLLNRYLTTGHHLARMRGSKGFAALGYRKWTDYLDSKPHRRTFLSYLLKLGRAGDPVEYLKQGMTAAHVIEYIQRLGYPEKLPELVAATWEGVKDLSPTVAGEYIAHFVAAHPGFTKPRKKREVSRHGVKQETPMLSACEVKEANGAPPMNLADDPAPIAWIDRFQAEFDALLINERGHYCLQMEQFLKRVN